MFFSIVMIALGIYTIFYGAKIIFTGKVSKKEEAKISAYSQKGARTYKLLNAGLSIVVGLCIIAQSIINILETQGILSDTFIYLMIPWVIILIAIVVYFIVAAQCKNMKDQ
ncbi:MAG: hypothetical protein IJH96_01810 [Ruminococcus sp.]|nr:hypothetical protein [Ruminococcus sp.]